VNLTELKVEVDEILDEQEESAFLRLASSIRRLVEEDDWGALVELIGSETTANIRQQVNEMGKLQFLNSLQQMSRRNSEDLIRAVKKTLMDAVSFHVRGSLGEKLAELHERADKQSRKSDLLILAFTDRLTDLIFPAAERAAKLTDLIAREGVNTAAEKYLEEACYCYFYELYSASAVMCRAVLEAVLRRQIRSLASDQSRGMTDTDNTLGPLVSKAKTLKIIPPEAFREIDRVKELGDRAAHGDPLREEDAWESLSAARHAVTCILQARN